MTEAEMITVEKLKKTAMEAQTKVYLTLREEASHAPSTLGKAPWENLIMGPMLGQPSSRVESFEHTRSTFRTYLRMLSALAMIIGTLLIVDFICG